MGGAGRLRSAMTASCCACRHFEHVVDTRPPAIRLSAAAAARLGLAAFECMAAGARASAVTVSRLGAQQSIPTRAEVEHWFVKR
ncbi:MAG: hypothetical protein ACLU0O_02305 [Collinsella sp.]